MTQETLNERRRASAVFGPVPASEAVADFGAFIRASAASSATAAAVAFGRAVLAPPDKTGHIQRALMVPATVQAPSWHAGMQ